MTSTPIGIAPIRIAPIRSALIAGLLFCGVGLAGCSDQTPPPPPPPLAPPPTPAAFELSPAVIGSAAAYEDYMARASLVDPNFKNGDDVAQALKLGASDNPQALLRGEIAYAAIAALQDPNYVATVRGYSENDIGRRQLASLIEQDPRYVLGLTGADTAAGLAIAALMGQGRKLSADGAAVTQAAYDVQHQAWSKEFVPNRDQRLADAKSATVSSFVGRADEIAHLQRAAAGFDPLPLNAPAASAPYPPVVIRGLAVAALAVLGEAGDENATLVEPLLSDPTSANCLNMAKLNLYQCLAVAKPYYEDIFCLGQHAMSDTGECVMIDAGTPVPPAPSTLIPAAAPEPAAPAKPAPKKRHHTS